jgi:hypothetical protein
MSEPAALTADVVAETLERLNRPRMAALVRDLGRDAANRRVETESLRAELSRVRARLHEWEPPTFAEPKHCRSEWE